MSPILQRSPRIAPILLLSLCFHLLSPMAARSHGFGQRFDLPIPLNFYLLGAAATVALSFLLVAIFVRSGNQLDPYPRLNLLRWRIGILLAHPFTLFCSRIVSVGIFFTLLAAGFGGEQNPARNIVPTFIWIIWWTGFAYISALFGNFWALINPWKILYGWFEGAFNYFLPDRTFGFHIPYPAWLGVWPAFIFFILFVWGELVWEKNAIPENLACVIFAYSATMWIGMFLFGKHPWLRGGDAFSVAFGFLARFSPSEIRVDDDAVCASCSAQECQQGHDCVDCHECFERALELQGHDTSAPREWNLRPFGVGLLNREAVSSSQMAFVLLMLASVSFDGFMATPLWKHAFDIITSARFLMPLLHELNMLGMSVDSIVATVGLLLAPTLFLTVYLAFSFLMKLAAGASGRAPGATGSTLWTARYFVLSLIPIAIAYHLAHYLSFLFIAGQLVIPLASDPFGFGWDLLGTARYRVDAGLIGARFAWYASISSVVLGHVIAVYLGHVLALRGFPSRKSALKSQYPMLLLMLFYTFVGLWILAQPIVE